MATNPMQKKAKKKTRSAPSLFMFFETFIAIAIIIIANSTLLYFKQKISFIFYIIYLLHL